MVQRARNAHYLRDRARNIRKYDFTRKNVFTARKIDSIFLEPKKRLGNLDSKIHADFYKIASIPDNKSR